MARQKRLRKVVAPPGFKGFKPYGARGRRAGTIDLLYEEYEAIKLADFDGMKQEEASRLMGISRPTFARIYQLARQKIAQALVEVKEIRAIYGHTLMDKSWFICNSCHARFSLPNKEFSSNCPLCKSDNMEAINKIAESGNGRTRLKAEKD